MSDDEAQGRRGTVAVRAKLGRAKLAEMAGAAEDALTALRKDSQATRRRTATGKKACEISVCLKVVTPILGGGPKLRDVDRVDSIRVPTVRGHLRFWWRALYGHLYDTPQKLYEAESALGGRPADNDGGGRSEVEVRIDVDRATVPEPDTSRVSIGRTEGYGLWPAREPPADRRPPGAEFGLKVIFPKRRMRPPKLGRGSLPRLRGLFSTRSLDSAVLTGTRRHAACHDR
jgi:hypothetical protein